MLVGVTVEVLLRTGLRVGEYTALPADALMLIGGAPWLHVPVGKLGEDRFLPLHPHVATVIETYRAQHVPGDHALLLPRENGTALGRHSVTRMINRAGRKAGLPHIHPHQLRHTLATQFRGMSLEAIAALLGHRSLDMTVRYAKIANRTVSEEYFAVADQVDALHTTPPSASTATGCPGVTRLHRDQGRMLGNGWCARPSELDCGYETICESCDFFTTGHGFQPILQAQHDDAAAKAQLSRQELFAQLLTGLNQDVS